MTNLEQLKVSIAAAEEIDPAIERWLLGVRSLQRMLSERIILLCRYSNSFPEEVLLEYANALQEALQNNALEEKIRVSKRLNQRIVEFLARLDDAGQSTKSSSIRRALEERVYVDS